MKAVNQAVFLSLSLFMAICESSDPIVQLPLGKVRGKHEDGYYSFNNIPFAEPPLGHRRFANPVPYTQAWSDIRDGTQEMISCIKFGSYMLYPGSEDCLYIHIATPSYTCDRLYPVRIQIHGGGYAFGGPDQADHSILATHGMIVAAMGYRLGPLGFLSSGDSVISGNFGIKDQRLAIEWVKHNIEHFCGDPDKIILAGLSAGGSSAHMHILQKSTEHYVKGIASHAGVSLCPWAFIENPKLSYQRFVQLLNCPMHLEPEEMKYCLREKPIEELLHAANSMQYFKGNPFTVFAPVVECPHSVDPFITEDPREIIRKGRTANVTWLVSHSEREGSCNAATFLSTNEDHTMDIDMLNERWTELAPYYLFYNDTRNENEKAHYSMFLRDTYLGEKKFSLENYRLLEDIFTHVLFTNGIHEAIDLHRRYSYGKVYAFEYRYPVKVGLGTLFSQRYDMSFGADHWAEASFVTPFKNTKQEVTSEKDKLVSKSMINMYLDFANTGVPTFNNEPLPVSGPKEKNVFVIDEALVEGLLHG